MSTDEYYYVPPDQVPTHLAAPMLVERMMLNVHDEEGRTIARLKREMKRLRKERGPNVKLFITIAAVLPSNV
jgi:hypothetical protein